MCRVASTIEGGLHQFDFLIPVMLHDMAVLIVYPTSGFLATKINHLWIWDRFKQPKDLILIGMRGKIMSVTVLDMVIRGTLHSIVFSPVRAVQDKTLMDPKTTTYTMIVGTSSILLL